MSSNDVAGELATLYRTKGSEAYFGERVTQLQHALQSAHLAKLAKADDEMVLAALLHDIGHLLGGDTHDTLGVIDHDHAALAWLRERGFSERLLALVGGHVDAKRYLTATDAAYRERLSEASKQTLLLQGGPMCDLEAAAFRRNTHFEEMLRVRAWDEQAKDPAALTEPFEAYRAMLEAHLIRRGS